MKLSSKEDQALIMRPKQETRLFNMSKSLATQLYINDHNLQFDCWIELKFYHEILMTMFPTGLEFYSYQILERPYNKAKKLLQGLRFYLYKSWALCFILLVLLK